MSPTKVSHWKQFSRFYFFLFCQYIFECSLSGDIPGILCGIVHGGLVSEQDGDEGNRYPIHQACIAVSMT